MPQASGRKKIAIIGGDGIGPSVTHEAKLLLELYRDRAGLPLDLWELDLGADRFLRDGTTFPKEIQIAIQRECAAVLLGALGDPRVTGLVLINPRRLDWKEGETLQSAMQRSYKSSHFYRRALLEASTYRRLVKGEIDVRGIARRLVTLTQARAERAARRLLGQAPAEENVLANMRLLSERGTDILLIVAETDDGLDYLEYHLGPRGRHMQGQPNFRMLMVAGADHTLSQADSQQHVIEAVREHLDHTAND